MPSFFAKLMGTGDRSSDLMRKFIEDKSAGGLLSTLTPPTSEELRGIREGFAGLSEQYLTFIEEVGVGASLGEEFYIYPPQRVEDFTEHQSFRLYNSPGFKGLFRSARNSDRIKGGVIAVADTGAGWRYCLSLGRSDAVLCFVFLGPEIAPEADDFFTFIDRLLADTQAINRG